MIQKLLDMLPEGSLISISMIIIAIIATAGYWYFYLKPKTFGVDEVQFNVPEILPIDEVSDIMQEVQEEL